MATLYDEINLMISEFWRGPKERWEKDTHDEMGKIVLKLIHNTHFVLCRGIKPKYFPSCTFLEATLSGQCFLCMEKHSWCKLGDWKRESID